MNSVIGQIIAWIIAGYLLGSVSFGMLVGKDAGVDIRTKGSGNIVTTNALRTLGKLSLEIFSRHLYLLSLQKMFQ